MRRKLLISLMVIGVGVFVFARRGFSEERPVTVTGDYPQALRKAAELGKPLMIDFYTDWCHWCKVMDSVMEQIPDTMNRFAYYRVNAEQNVPLARQFKVAGYPTIVFIRPDGTEFHRWSGAYKTPNELKQVLEAVLKKAGAIKPEPSTPLTPAQQSAAESASANDLKTAEIYMTVGRKNDAAKAYRQILTKYPGTEAAATAQEKLDEIDSSAKR